MLGTSTSVKSTGYLVQPFYIYFKVFIFKVKQKAVKTGKHTYIIVISITSNVTTIQP